jgi:hypothetical protein
VHIIVFTAVKGTYTGEHCDAPNTTISPTHAEHCICLALTLGSSSVQQLLGSELDMRAAERTHLEGSPDS